MRESHNIEGSTIRLQPNSFITNPELKTLSTSNKFIDETNDISIK